MDTIQIIQYIFYGYSILVCFIAYVFANDLLVPKFFRRIINAGIISFLFGLYFEYNDTFSKERGLTLLIMSITLIYLFYYELLRRIFKKRNGINPYSTSIGPKVGDTLSNGIWIKYPIERRVTSSDIIFTLLKYIFTVVTISGLLILIYELN